MGGGDLVDPGSGGPAEPAAAIGEGGEQGVILAPGLVRAHVERRGAGQGGPAPHQRVAAAIGLVDQPGRGGARPAEEVLEVGPQPVGGPGRAAPNRPEHHVGAGLVLGRQQLGQPVRRGDLVVVEKGDQRGVRGLQSHIAGRGHTGHRRMAIDQRPRRPPAQGLDGGGGRSGRIVVDHHDLAQAIGDLGLGEQGLQRPAQPLGTTQGRDDDGRRPAHAPPAGPGPPGYSPRATGYR